jgi:S-phase kinase-associated protein 1
MIDLVSQEGDTFKVDVKVANMSELIKTMIPEDDDDDSEAQEIPLPNVKTAVLKQVIDFCKHYLEEPVTEMKKPLESGNLSELVQEWYVSFVNLDKEPLFELILAANYLGIKQLLELSCAKLATMIKGKTPEQIHEEFDEGNPLSPEEIAQVAIPSLCLLNKCLDVLFCASCFFQKGSS